MINLKNELESRAKGHGGEVHINLFENSKGAKAAFEKGDVQYAVLRKITANDGELVGLDIVSSNEDERCPVDLTKFLEQEYLEEHAEDYEDLSIKIISEPLPFTVIDGGEGQRGGRRYQVQFDLGNPIFDKTIQI